jgi:hypothetical protein
MASQDFRINGIVVSKATGSGVAGLRVEAWDKDLIFDDLLGSAVTDEAGHFRIELRSEVFREICFDRRPDVFFRVYRGELLLASSENQVLWNVEHPEIEIGIPVDLPTDWGSLVKGRVHQPDGRVVAGARVKAFDKRLRVEAPLGEAVTDAQGAYRISYGGESAGAGGSGLTGLIVRAYDTDDVELAASSVVFHPETEETLDLVVGNAAYRGPSEYERLVATLTPLLEGLSLEDLAEDEEYKDITLLSGRSGEDPMAIAVLVAAHQLARRTEIAPEVFYGLLRNDLPPNVPGLLMQDRDLVRRSVELAVADNIIPAHFAEGIDALLERFRQLSVNEAVRPVQDGEEPPPLVSLLGTVLSDRDQQATFIERYVDHSGPIDEFWEDLRSDPALLDKVDSLQFGLQVGALTGNHLPLVRELQRMREQGEDVGGSSHRIQTFRDLVYLDEDKWQEIIRRDTAEGRIGAPAGTPGKNEQEQTRQYARTLSRMVERSFPTAYVAARMEHEDETGRDPVPAFLKRNLDSFEIEGTRLETYLAEHPSALDEIPYDDRPALKQRLRAMQRVYRIAPRYEAMSALVKDGIDSAHAIVDMGREQFALRYGLQSPMDSVRTAYSISARAERIHAMALSVATDHGMSGMRLPMKAVPDKRATSDASIPDWQTLFGSLELCDCEHCRSVYSPAAYLVDLLHFLKGRKIIDQDSIERDDYGYISKVSFLTNEKTGAYLTAKDILFSRRADLGRIELTCANTNTALPYVDVINEALEEYIAAPAEFSVFELTTVSATELDQRKVSKALRGAFVKALGRCILCAGATIEVVKKGEHWRLHDCAYSYDIRRESGNPKVRTRGRQTRGTQQELAANPQYLNPKAYNKLRNGVFPLTLPFDLWDAEARTYLEHLGVKRHRLMETLLPGTREERLDKPAIALAHLGITPAEARLIADDTGGETAAATPDAWTLWGFEKETGSTIPDPADSTAWLVASKSWLDLLASRVDVFLQQSGLKHEELLGLLGTYFVNPRQAGGGRLIGLTARKGKPEDTCETAGLCLTGMDKDAAGRALRFIRLWRKLDWNMQDLDRALTALDVNSRPPWAGPPTTDVIATGPSPITGSVLTQLSHIQRLHEGLGVAVERLLPFWGTIDCDRYVDHDSPGQPFFPTLYERLFRNKQVVNPPDPAFTEDPLELAGKDPSQPAKKLSGHRAAIASALGLAATDLDRLIGYCFPSGDATLSLENLSTLHRHALLADSVGLSIPDYLIALKLAFDPFASTTKTLLFVEQIQALSDSDLNLVELDYLSRHQILESERAAPTAAEIARELTALRGELQRIAAEHRFEDDPTAPGGPTVDGDGKLTAAKLALLGWPGVLIDQVVDTLNDSVVYRVAVPPPSTTPSTTARDFAKEIAKLNADPGTYAVELASLPATVSIPLGSNNKPIVTHAGSKLKADHRLTAGERTALRKAVTGEGHAAIRSAVEELIDLQDGYLTKISYDQDRKELCFTGVMRPSRLETLTSASLATTMPDFKKAVQALYDSPRSFAKRNLRGFVIETFSTHLEKLPLEPPPDDPSSKIKRPIRFPAALRDKIIFDPKGVCDQGKTGCLSFSGAMSEDEKTMLLKLSADSDYQTAVKALDSAPTQGASKDVFVTKEDVVALFDQARIPVERFELLLQRKETQKKKTSKQKGLIEHLRDRLSRGAVVKALSEALALETETAGDLLTKWLDLPGKTGTPLIDAFLDEKFAGSSRRLKVTEARFGDQFDAYLLLHKSALVINRFECTPRQASWLFRYQTVADWSDLNALPVESATKPTATLEDWLKLAQLFEVRDSVSRGEEMLDDLLARAAAKTIGTTDEQKETSRSINKKAYLKVLRQWTQWPDTDLDLLVGDDEKSGKLGQLKAKFPDDYRGASLLARVRDCFELLEQTGLSAADAGTLAAEEVNQAAARAAKEAARSKYDETQWLKIAPPLRNALRERQRAALVAYLLSKPDPKAEPCWRKISDVYGYFLLDVEMSPCQLTSRIKQAISSVQLFAQRCLMGLERHKKQQVLASAETDDRWREWRWMKNYRVWEANRKIFLYPENWIEPELRDDKTPLFEALEGELLQTNLTKDTAAKAFRRYLQKLDAVARLEVVGMYHERGTDLSGQTAVDHLHVFGRTVGTPHQYYYRRQIKGRYWTAWERVDLDIGGEESLEGDEKVGGSSEPIPDHLIPVVSLGRLFLIWPIFTEEAKAPKKEGGDPLKGWKVQLASSEYKDGKWLPKKVSETAYRQEFLKKNLPKERFVFEAFPAKSGTFGEPRLVVKGYVLNKGAQCRSTSTDPENFHKDYSRVIWFTLDGCKGDFRIWATGHSGLLARPPAMGPKGMTLCPCGSSMGKVYLPTSLYQANSAEALAKTPADGFRLLYAHHSGTFSALRNNPWFYNVKPRTYWVHPKWRFANITLKKTDPGVSEALSAVGSSGFSLSFTQADPFASIVAGDPRTPMVNRGDPLLEDAVTVAPADLDTGVAAGLSADDPDLRERESFPVMESARAGAATDVGSEDTTPLGNIEGYFYTASGLQTAARIATIPEFTYRFHPFYHPYVCRFMEALNVNGVDGLLQRPMQLLSDLKLHPTERNLFTWEYKPKTGIGALIDSNYPKEEVDFSLGGAYSQYNWELFFHAPLLIADSLRRNQRFEDAQRWFHYIFDPTDSSGLPVPDRYWRTKPFYERTTEDYQTQQVSLLLRLMASGGHAEKLSGVSDSTKADLKETYEDLQDAVEDWREDPFKPHLVARMRTTAYQKTVVMKYLDNLIEWGDQLFRRGTMEANNEATQLYVLAADILGKRPEEIPPRVTPKVHTYDSLEPLLGLFSNALVQMEELVPPSVLSSGGGRSREPLPSLPTTLYFCTPKNDVLLAYWDKVADRLFKIRHCMNIEGVVRQLPLFAPPINPALLVKAAAAGLDLSSVLAEIGAPLPHYRFQVLSQKATELCGELKSLAAALLSALERRDAEQLALLRAEQETALLKLTEQVRKQQEIEAAQQIDVLKAARAIAAERYEHFQKLLKGVKGTVPKLPAVPKNKNATPGNVDLPQSSGNAESGSERGVQTILHEDSQLGSMAGAKDWQIAASLMDTAASVAHIVPNFAVKLGVKEVQWGGSHAGSALSAFASFFRLIANASSYEASLSEHMARYVMRAHGWVREARSAGKEITHIDQQIISAHIRKDITTRELSNHRKQIEQSKKVEKTLRDKFTDRELYNWMVGQISGVYFRSYQLAYDLAKRAERAFRHELGLADSSYIQFGYWDSLKKGLLAGERLTQDLKRMEVAYLEKNRRELEITKHVSLVQLDAVALIELREKGKCQFDVPEVLFDLDYPGHYMRRIKTVSLTIPCVTGPYTGVACTLTLVRSSIRHSNLLSGGKYARNAEGDDARFTDSVGLAQSIVTSSGRDDSGLFETNLRDERFLPFEGAGAISTWQLELPDTFKPFDYDTITDVVLRIRYTARMAGGLLKQQAISELTAAVNAIAKGDDEKGLARVFSLRHEFPSQWQSLVTLPKTAAGTKKQTQTQEQTRRCTFDTRKERFPYLFQGRTIKVDKVEAFVGFGMDTDGGKSKTAPTLALEALETGKKAQTKPCASKSKSGTLGSKTNNAVQEPKQVNGLWRAEWKQPPKQLGQWVLSACLDADTAAVLEDVLVVCHYEIE